MRRLKIKNIIILLLIILVLVIFIFILSNKKESTNNQDKKIDIVENVYLKLKGYDVDKNFISWVNYNYKDSINKLDNLLKVNEYDKTMWHDVTGYSYIVLSDLYNKVYDDMDNVKILESKELSTLSFVGDVCLADDWFIAPKYDERNKGVRGIISDDILDIMTSSDLMVVNSEFTVSNRGNKLENKYYTFRAKPERLSIYDEMGVDMVTLANNHVYDYGEDAFLDMLDAFDEKGMPYVGAGRNINDAMRPYYFIINGYKFAFVNATRAEKNIMTPEATDTSGGVFRCYDETNLINLIKEIRSNTDYVIAIIHYGKEFSHELEDVQVKSSRDYIDAGADAVIGHHAHVLQGVELYNNKPIIYNLGNFIFNSEEIDTAIFKIEIDNKGNMEYYIVPALQKDTYTDILKGDLKQKLIDDMNSWSINAFLDSTGKINNR